MPLSSKLAIGKLRHRIDIVAPSGAQDSMGGILDTNYKLVKRTWASIEAATGKDQLAAGQFVETVTHKITVRFDKHISINGSQWIFFRGRQFQILYVVNPDERSKLLYIFAVEVNDSKEQTVQPVDGTG